MIRAMRAFIANRREHGVKGSFVVAVALALLVSVMVFAANPGIAYGCSCGDSGSPWESLARNDVVFAGWVVSIDRPNAASLGFGDLTTVRFDVIRVWKGGVTQRQVVDATAFGEDCTYQFEEGEGYIVYASWRSRHGTSGYGASQCGRTALLSKARVDLLALGAGEAPQWGTGDGPGDPRAWQWRAALMAVVVVIVAVGGMARAERLRDRGGGGRGGPLTRRPTNPRGRIRSWWYTSI